jgi:acetyl-CoA C-acetyltransferase
MQYYRLYKEEIVKLLIKDNTNDIFFELNEGHSKVVYEKISLPKSIFDNKGIVNATNFSSIRDGAATLSIMREKKANELGLVPVVKIIIQASADKTPIQFSSASADAIKKVLAKTSLTKDNISLYEINKAFDVVSLAINVNGVAIALGPNISALGARILVILIYKIKRKNSVFNLAYLCMGREAQQLQLLKIM